MKEKANKRILEALSAWEKRSVKSTRALQRDVRIMVLNGVCMAYHREQFGCAITVAAEYDHPIQEHSLSFREAEEAAEDVARFLREENCRSEVVRRWGEGKDRYIACLIVVETSGITNITQDNIKEIRNRHWKERSERMKKEGGARKRKTKKGRKKK